MTVKWHEIIVEMDTKLDVMKERMDRHAQYNENRFNGISNKLDDLTEKVHTNEVTVVKETGATNAKVASISGTVAILTALIFHWLKAKFGGN